MSHGRGHGGRAYWLSVFIGAFVGVTLQIAITAWREPIEKSELWAVPVLILTYGLFAVPFVALGLAIFGLPATSLLRRYAQDWWVGLVAAVWGAAAGKMMYFLIDHLIFFGFYDFSEVARLDVGVLYGLPTGLAWWLSYRRELVGR